MAVTGAQKTMEIFFSTEEVADKILVIKQEIIDLDKHRQQIREAIRQIEKGNEKKVWINVGVLLVKMEAEKGLELLKKERQQIDIEINKLRTEQKDLLAKHRDLEHKSPIKGFNLLPMSSNEMSVLKTNLPLS